MEYALYYGSLDWCLQHLGKELFIRYVYMCPGMTLDVDINMNIYICILVQSYKYVDEYV